MKDFTQAVTGATDGINDLFRSRLGAGVNVVFKTSLSKPSRPTPLARTVKLILQMLVLFAPAAASFGFFLGMAGPGPESDGLWGLMFGMVAHAIFTPLLSLVLAAFTWKKWDEERRKKEYVFSWDSHNVRPYQYGGPKDTYPWELKVYRGWGDPKKYPDVEGRFRVTFDWLYQEDPDFDLSSVIASAEGTLEDKLSKEDKAQRERDAARLAKAKKALEVSGTLAQHEAVQREVIRRLEASAEVPR